jgi:hypothetical protein
MLKEIKENLNKWKDILDSGLGRVNMKVVILLSKLIC